MRGGEWLTSRLNFCRAGSATKSRMFHVSDFLSYECLQRIVRHFSDDKIIHDRKEWEGGGDLPHTIVRSFHTITSTTLMIARLERQKKQESFTCLFLLDNCFQRNNRHFSDGKVIHNRGEWEEGNGLHRAFVRNLYTVAVTALGFARMVV